MRTPLSNLPTPCLPGRRNSVSKETHHAPHTCGGPGSTRAGKHSAALRKRQLEAREILRLATGGHDPRNSRWSVRRPGHQPAEESSIRSLLTRNAVPSQRSVSFHEGRAKVADTSRLPPPMSVHCGQRNSCKFWVDQLAELASLQLFRSVESKVTGLCVVLTTPCTKPVPTPTGSTARRKGLPQSHEICHGICTHQPTHTAHHVVHRWQNLAHHPCSRALSVVTLFGLSLICICSFVQWTSLICIVANATVRSVVCDSIGPDAPLQKS